MLGFKREHTPLKKFRRYKVDDISWSICHVVVEKKNHNTVKIQRGVWLRYRNDDYFTAVKPSQLSRDIRQSREFKKWRQCYTLEFGFKDITDCPLSIQALKDAGYVEGSKESDYVLTQPESKIHFPDHVMNVI